VNSKTIRDIWNRETWVRATRALWTEEEEEAYREAARSKGEADGAAAEGGAAAAAPRGEEGGDEAQVRRGWGRGGKGIFSMGKEELGRSENVPRIFLPALGLETMRLRPRANFFSPPPLSGRVVHNRSPWGGGRNNNAIDADCCSTTIDHD
jgi:hypothetical protein